MEISVATLQRQIQTCTQLHTVVDNGQHVWISCSFLTMFKSQMFISTLQAYKLTGTGVVARGHLTIQSVLRPFWTHAWAPPISCFCRDFLSKTQFLQRDACGGFPIPSVSGKKVFGRLWVFCTHQRGQRSQHWSVREAHPNGSSWFPQAEGNQNKTGTTTSSEGNQQRRTTSRQV